MNEKQDYIKISKKIAISLDEEFLNLLSNYAKNNDEFKDIAEITIPLISEMFFIGQIGRFCEYLKTVGMTQEKINLFIDLSKRNMINSIDKLKEYNKKP